MYCIQMTVVFIGGIIFKMNLKKFLDTVLGTYQES